MRSIIGELGMALLMIAGALMGIHLALVVICGFSVVSVLYWLWLIVPAFGMAVLHPQPGRRRPGRLR